MRKHGNECFIPAMHGNDFFEEEEEAVLWSGFYIYVCIMQVSSPFSVVVVVARNFR
jgi:hypothetical protein